MCAADVDPARVEALCAKLGLTMVSPDQILGRAVDLLAPCAIGGVIDADRASTLRAGIVCGGANNILDADATADDLHARGIVMVPDFLANAGGAVHGALTHLRGPADYTAEVKAIEERTADLLTEAARRDIAPLRLALARYEGV